jgi:isoamylase
MTHSSSDREMKAGDWTTLGATSNGDGFNFAIFSAHAERVELRLFDESGQTETDRITLPEFMNEIWHGFVPGLKAGALYPLNLQSPRRKRKLRDAGSEAGLSAISV